MPFISLPTHGWARKMYRQIKRDILASSGRGVTEEQIRNSLYKLKTGQYIKRIPVEKKGKLIGFRLELTGRGKKLLSRYALDDLCIPQQKRWDRKWRFVIFDIPEKHHLYRDALRDKLKRLGFFRIQHSVWTHPYPCQKEVDLLSEALGLQKCVLVFWAEIKNDWQLRSYFREKGFKL